MKYLLHTVISVCTFRTLRQRWCSQMIVDIRNFLMKKILHVFRTWNYSKSSSINSFLKLFLKLIFHVLATTNGYIALFTRMKVKLKYQTVQPTLKIKLELHMKYYKIIFQSTHHGTSQRQEFHKKTLFQNIFKNNILVVQTYGLILIIEEKKRFKNIFLRNFDKILLFNAERTLKHMLFAFKLDYIVM